MKHSHSDFSVMEHHDNAPEEPAPKRQQDADADLALVALNALKDAKLTIVTATKLTDALTKAIHASASSLPPLYGKRFAKNAHYAVLSAPTMADTIEEIRPDLICTRDGNDMIICDTSSDETRTHSKAWLLPDGSLFARNRADSTATLYTCDGTIHVITKTDCQPRWIFPPDCASVFISAALVGTKLVCDEYGARFTMTFDWHPDGTINDNPNKTFNKLAVTV